MQLVDGKVLCYGAGKVLARIKPRISSVRLGKSAECKIAS